MDDRSRMADDSDLTRYSTSSYAGPPSPLHHLPLNGPDPALHPLVGPPPTRSALTMATTSIPTAPDAAEGAAAAPSGGGKKLTIIGAVAGIVLGSLVGAMVIAPRLEPKAETAEVVAEEGGEHA